MQRTSVLIKSLLAFHAFCLISSIAWAQPEPCGVDEMTSTCLDACVVCDIDGFTGRNNLTIQGQTFPGFCTTIFHNMSYIAFIAGTTDLTIDVSVSNCTTNNGVEVGIFESLDCDTFTPVTDCNTDVPPNGTARFSNTVPLVVGQHYYVVMDGSRGDICDWTFNVVTGSTLVGELTTSGPIDGPNDWCPANTTTFSANPQTGATFFEWTIDGVVQGSQTTELDYTFSAEGTYEICVTASNVCDEAPATCTTVFVSTPRTILVDTICANECVDVAGETICISGLHQFEIPLSNGCDSLVILNLTVLPDLGDVIDISLCDGESFLIGNNTFSTTGSYVETIVNINGCDSTVTLNLTVIDCELVANIDHTSPSCNGSQDATILISLTNGIPPFNYQWNDIRNTTLNGSGTLNILADLLIENLSAGTYQITITDSFGDDVAFVHEIVEPPVFTVDIDAQEQNGYNLSCFDSSNGEATVLGSGGIQPYTYLWSNAERTATIFSQDAGFYEVAVTDANGCIERDTITLIAPTEISFVTRFVNPNCEGEETGVVQLDTIRGGVEPYTYALNGSAYVTNESFEGLVGGLYEYSILDANGCSADTSASLVAPDIPMLFMGADADIELGEDVRLFAQTNNSELIDIQWTSTEGSVVCDSCLSTSALPVNSTQFVLTVTSIDDCVTRDSLYVNVNKIRDIFVPTAFSPNGDGVNDFLSVFANQGVSNVSTFKVFNRWGDMVYDTYDLTPNLAGSGWDGLCRGEKMNNGVFVWMAEVEYLDGETIVMKGNVTMVK